jgi:outer membrane protein insertion porin family
VEKVEFETKPVAGSADLVDVDYNIKEGLPGQFGGGIGYSQSQGFSLNGNFVHSNFMGTGDRIALDLNAGRYNKVYVVSHTDPYTTIDGVSRTSSLSYRDSTQFVSASSQLSNEQITASMSWTYPITEYQGLQIGVSANEVTLNTTLNYASLQAVDWVQLNGHTYSSRDFEPTASYYFYGTRFNTYEVSAGWSIDTRNRALFADRGMHNAISGRIAMPLSDVRYYTLNYEFRQYIPLWRKYLLSLHAGVDYGSPLGGTTSLPPYLNYFGGGADSVRGYRESRLGPKDNIGSGNPYGGNLRIIGSAELIFPVPDKWKSAARVSWFYDVGNVFQTGSKVQFKGADNYSPVQYHFENWSDLKRSTGIAVQWLAPLGLFRFSFGIPLNARSGDGVTFPDETERFQFSIGQAF